VLFWLATVVGYLIAAFVRALVLGE